ncbi:hypothetical protein V2J09_003690 [Rumex salicifolius]
MAAGPLIRKTFEVLRLLASREVTSMSTPSRKRLMRDFKRLQQDPPAGISGAPQDNNIMLWNAVIFGPDDTPWDGGTFKLTLQFSEDYPNKPPTVRFVSRMFHPNIYADGSICLDILQNQWSPIYDVAAILTSIQSLLCDPNPNSPANSEAARMYSENKRDYNRRLYLGWQGDFVAAHFRSEAFIQEYSFNAQVVAIEAGLMYTRLAPREGNSGPIRLLPRSSSWREFNPVRSGTLPLMRLLKRTRLLRIFNDAIEAGTPPYMKLEVKLSTSKEDNLLILSGNGPHMPSETNKRVGERMESLEVRKTQQTIERRNGIVCLTVATLSVHRMIDNPVRRIPP